MSALTFETLSTELTQALAEQAAAPPRTIARCTLGRDKVMVLVEYPLDSASAEPTAQQTLDWLEQYLRQHFDTTGLPDEAADLSEDTEAVPVQLYLKHMSEARPFTMRSFTWKVADGFDDLFGQSTAIESNILSVSALETSLTSSKDPDLSQAGLSKTECSKTITAETAAPESSQLGYKADSASAVDPSSTETPISETVSTRINTVSNANATVILEESDAPTLSSEQPSDHLPDYLPNQPIDQPSADQPPTDQPINSTLITADSAAMLPEGEEERVLSELESDLSLDLETDDVDVLDADLDNDLEDDFGFDIALEADGSSDRNLETSADLSLGPNHLEPNELGLDDLGLDDLSLELNSSANSPLISDPSINSSEALDADLSLGLGTSGTVIPSNATDFSLPGEAPTIESAEFELPTVDLPIAVPNLDTEVSTDFFELKDDSPSLPETETTAQDLFELNPLDSFIQDSESEASPTLELNEIEVSEQQIEEPKPEASEPEELKLSDVAEFETEESEIGEPGIEKPETAEIASAIYEADNLDFTQLGTETEEPEQINLAGLEALKLAAAELETESSTPEISKPDISKQGDIELDSIELDSTELKNTNPLEAFLPVEDQQVLADASTAFEGSDTILDDLETEELDTADLETEELETDDLEAEELKTESLETKSLETEDLEIDHEVANGAIADDTDFGVSDSIDLVPTNLNDFSIETETPEDEISADEFLDIDRPDGEPLLSRANADPSIDESLADKLSDRTRLDNELSEPESSLSERSELETHQNEIETQDELAQDELAQQKLNQDDLSETELDEEPETNAETDTEEEEDYDLYDYEISDSDAPDEDDYVEDEDSAYYLEGVEGEEDTLEDYEDVALVDDVEVQRQREQWKQQTKGSPLVIVGAFGFVLAGVLGYVFTRPCTVGSCDRIETAQAKGSEAISSLSVASNAKEVTAAKKELKHSIQMLDPIPVWSSRYDEAQAILPSYEQQLSALDLVTEAQGQAYSAAVKSQDPPHPASTWEEVANQWREATSLLSKVPLDSPVRSLAERKLVEYRANLSTILVRIETESGAEVSLRQAQTAASQATQNMAQADSLEAWEAVLADWSTAVENLKRIPKGSQAYGEAQKILPEYEEKLLEARTKVEQEQSASRVLLRAGEFATAAQTAEKQEQWTASVENWNQAVFQLSEVPESSLAYPEAQSWLMTYTGALGAAENNMQVALRFAPIEPSFYLICGASELQKCTYSVVAGKVRLDLSPGYDAVINESITPPPQRTGIDSSTQLVSQSNQLLQQITLLSTQAQIPVELYSSEGTFLARYRPDLDGFVRQ
ncbi:MAG: hypothetical protein AAFQ63_05650 [Cyanobacteria bacterium J06621_11]